MAKIKKLLDIFRFPGFVPRPKVRGVFGDPRAVVISLQRRRKKRFAGSVDRSFVPTTTSDHAASAICPVATSVSISPSRFAASAAPGVAA